MVESWEQSPGENDNNESREHYHPTLHEGPTIGFLQVPWDNSTLMKLKK